jgi:hypothetical protein
MYNVRIFIGTQFDSAGQPLIPADVACALDDFQRSVARISGGVTVYSGSGISAECPAGEATVVVETFCEPVKYADIVSEVALLKLTLRQGSILVVNQFVEASFI